jgi:hypothetical protein
MIALKGNKYQDDEFNGIVQCKTKKECDDDLETQAVAGITLVAYVSCKRRTLVRRNNRQSNRAEGMHKSACRRLQPPESKFIV